jgi:CRISPR-associated protein Cas1
MLSLPDFKEKRIVTIFAEKDIDNQLRFWNSNIRMFKDGKPHDQISCYLVLALYIIGNTSITSSLIEKAQKYGISIHLLNYSFRQYAEINATAEGNTLIRKIQYTTTARSEFAQAKNLIENKLKNQIHLLNKYEHTKSAQYIEKEMLPRVQKVADEKELLGIEGTVANMYFSTLFAELEWNRRAPQTREDIPNFLLDIGYSFLLNLIDSLLRLFGFDTYKGFYHKLFFQRKSLSCDTMEPIRYIIDKALIKAYRLGRINKKDFTFKNGSFGFKPGIEIRKKYTGIFFWQLYEYREEIYAYTRAYYLHVANPKKYPFPHFHIAL